MDTIEVRRVAITVPGWRPAAPLASILLVSGDADFRGVATRVLERACYGVEAAAHGGHALLACMRQHFDIILIDAVTIDRSGRFVAGLLRQAPHARLAAIETRPQSADELLARVATLLAVAEPKQ